MSSDTGRNPPYEHPEVAFWRLEVVLIELCSSSHGLPVTTLDDRKTAGCLRRGLQRAIDRPTSLTDSSREQREPSSCRRMRRVRGHVGAAGRDSLPYRQVTRWVASESAPSTRRHIREARVCGVRPFARGCSPHARTDRHSGGFVGQPIQCRVSECCIFVRLEPSTCDRGIHHERHQLLCPSWRQAKISFVVTGFCLARSRRRISRAFSYRSPTIRVTRAIGTEMIRSSPCSTRAESAEPRHRWVFASPTFTRRVMQPGPPLHLWQQTALSRSCLSSSTCDCTLCRTSGLGNWLVR